MGYKFNPFTGTLDIAGGGGAGGDVVGPASSTDNAIVRFDGTTGKLIQDYTSNAPTISDSGQISSNNGAANSEMFGSGASVTGEQSAVFGAGASTTKFGSVAIGRSANVNGGTGYAIAIGRTANVAALYGISIGAASDVNTGHDASIALGSVAQTTAANQFVLGSESAPITTAYIGEGATSATPQSFSLNATGGSGTDIAASDFYINGGAGTGTGTGGHLIFQTASAGTTGSSLNSQTTRMTIDDEGLITFNADLTNKGGQTNSEVFGEAATVGGSNATAFGYSADAASTDTTAIGYNSGTASIRGTALGAFAYAQYSGVALGRNAQAGSSAIAIGSAASTVSRINSIAIGESAQATGNNQCLLGGSVGYIENFYLGKGVTSATPTAVQIENTSASGTNVAGTNLTIAASQGTGTGAGGHLIFRTASAGTTGSSLNTLTTQFEITDDGTVDAKGTLVSGDPSGTYANITQVGSGQTYTGEQSVVIGNTANAKNFSVSVGYGAACDDTGGVAIGHNATAGAASADMAIAIGREASATTVYSFAMGYFASAAGGTASTAIGYYANASGTATFAMGYQASATGTYAYAIGANTNASHTKSICMGRYSASVAANALTIGGANGYDINTVLIGNNDTNATPSALTIRMTDGSGTNVNASNMTFQAGRGTGTGTGGHIIFQTAAAGASGTSRNALTTQLEITDDGNIIMANLPTSASGLPTGALWNNSGAINIV